MPAFRFQPVPNTPTCTTKPPSQEWQYIASGSSDASTVISYAEAATPAIVSTPQGTLYRQDVKVDFTKSDFATVTVPYGPREKVNGSFKISFDTTGGTVNMKASYQTMGCYDVDDGALAAPFDEKGAIGHHGDEVDGTDVVIPALKLTVDFQHPLGVITLARIKSLARNSGKVNNASFLTFDAGEVLFLGATGSEGSDVETQVSYQFVMSENLRNEVIGGITVAEKDGWDYAWVKFAPAADAGNPVLPPKRIYVERVYRRANLAAILGFGA